ncbi:hypothetical protein H632_c210p0, partial [Helicosporidium sp. ATCC 50920]
YPRPALTVDTIVVSHPELPSHDKMEMLLIQRKHPPFQGHWALPGGFVDEGETLEQAAAREVEEETGYRVETHADLVQVGAFGDPGRDPRGWTVTVAYALAVPRTKPVEGADDATRAQWFSVEELPKPLAFDHDKIIRASFERLAQGARDAHAATLTLAASRLE